MARECYECGNKIEYDEERWEVSGDERYSREVFCSAECVESCTIDDDGNSESCVLVAGGVLGSKEHLKELVDNVKRYIRPQGSYEMTEMEEAVEELDEFICNMEK